MAPPGAVKAGIAIKGVAADLAKRDLERMIKPISPARLILRWVLGLSYLAAGIIHLRSPGGFIAVTPHWVPDIPLVIALTGMAEIAGALGLLLVPRLRKAAAIGLALYAVCVFPANINQAIYDIPVSGQHLSWWYHGPRMVLQPVLVWLALWVGGVIDWPFGREQDTAGS